MGFNSAFKGIKG